jgi:hypothetical protein
MALSLASPGISIREVDLTRGSITNSSILSAGIAGPFQKGPVNQVVTIRNENEFLRTFGKPSKQDYQYEYWYSGTNFMSYGGSLKVVRSDGNNLRNSNAAVGAASTTVKINNYDAYRESIPTSYYWTAKTPGYWADGLKVCVIDNFADQTLSGVSTSGVSVGVGVTQSIQNVTDYLKGIVTGVGPSQLYVKVTSKVSAAGTETTQNYTERGTYSFKPGSIKFSGNLEGTNSISLVRSGLGTYPASSVSIGNSFTVYDVSANTIIDNAGGSSTNIGDTTIFLASATGITIANYLLIGSEIIDILSVSGNAVGVARSVFGTLADTYTDGSEVKILTQYQNAFTASSGISTTSTTLGISTVPSYLSSDDILINQQTNEILLITGISQSGTISATSVSDWYNTQYALNRSAGDRTDLLWRSIAPRPRTNEYVADRLGSNDAINIAVFDSSKASNVSNTSEALLEKFVNLSKAKDGKVTPSENVYYVDYLALNSQYIYAGVLLDTDAYWGISPVTGAFTSGFTPSSTSLGIWGQEADSVSFNLIGNKKFTLLNGTDYSSLPSETNNIGGYDVEFSNLLNAYEKFENDAEVDVTFLLQGSASGSQEFEQQKANSLISIAENRKDCIAFISPNRSAVVNVANQSVQLENILSFFTPLTSSSYAVFDSGYQYFYDRYNNEFTYMPCSADIAGLCVRTDINQYPWFSPAGKSRGTLKNVIKLAYNPGQDHRDELYSNRINPIITSPGSGIVLFGDKTALSYPSAFDRINVRRLFIALQRSVKGAADAQLFEFNDSSTRANFINIVDPYLRDVQIKRGITDYLLVCDESNNTPDVIDRNEFIADIYVKPARSINYIGLTFIATRTGVSFETVVGTV